MTLLDKATRLGERLLIQPVLGPERVIMIISDLESFNCGKVLGSQFSIHEEGHNTGHNGSTRLYQDMQLHIICV